MNPRSYVRPIADLRRDGYSERSSCGLGVVANINGAKTRLILDQALTVIVNLEHRSATGADPRSGDGAGILIQFPDQFLRRVASQAGVAIAPDACYAVGVAFLPRDQKLQSECRDTVAAEVNQVGFRFLGWRDVPVESDAIGVGAAAVMPHISHFFVECPDIKSGADGDEDKLERMLYVLRKRLENRVEKILAQYPTLSEADQNLFYICSLSTRTMVYKGLVMPSQMSDFYPDLKASDMVSAFGLVHSRFSTNTLGRWNLAHPYRMVAHNGEINTVRGNRNWIHAREQTFKSDKFGDDIRHLSPVCDERDSDTASLDNVFELLYFGGRPVEHVATMMIPSAWYMNRSMSPEVRNFYEYHFAIQEPWDGPAMVAFTDGKRLGATLDRSGLRPFRYMVTKDDLLVMGSETGVLPVDPKRIKSLGQVASGEMFLVDFDQQRIVPYNELINKLADRQPYGAWLGRQRVKLSQIERVPDPERMDVSRVGRAQVAFGYTHEDISMLIEPMYAEGKQPNGSMGNDAPLAVLSERPQALSHYFKQLFAQVSNPPLDPIREKPVTQLAVPLGRNNNIFEETESHCGILELEHPIMLREELERLKSINNPNVKVGVIETLYAVKDGAVGMRQALERICSEADKAIATGCTILVLSDRNSDAEHSYVPPLLCVGGLHHYLIRNRNRGQASIVVDSGRTARSTGLRYVVRIRCFGVCPYLALETVRDRVAHEVSLNGTKSAQNPDKACEQYRLGAEAAVLKTLSKMGIATLQSYIGAQQFEAIGLSKDLIARCFTGTVSRIGGIGFEQIAADNSINHKRAYSSATAALDVGGLYHWRATGEKHAWNPKTIQLLQTATKLNNQVLYDQFEKAADKEQQLTIRSLLELNNDTANEIPLDQVEPASAIIKRFATGGISLGAISTEAHEALAIAMNRVGARSNSGEGGENPERFTPDENGDSRNSAIKQVASGRFGVTANYLAHASDLQIKMAQGAKPGEGGEIPGRKIDEYIAMIRGTTPGIGLISPPPHHDIYSIEDIAQLIYDLKNANPSARVHVKLVSETGVGVIAAGVAKAKADVVLISGHSGGTGASPLSSIRHAGVPWELGIAEAQKVMVSNGLRDRIVLQVDGQIKTAYDVVIATLLGAEEWGVATAALVVLGCIMLRKCHLNTCSVGVATQDPELRRRFKGTPEALVNYFLMLTENIRKYMAKLGFRTVDEMVGRADMLRQRGDAVIPKGTQLDLSSILESIEPIGEDKRYCVREQDHQLEKVLDQELIRVAKPALDDRHPVSGEFEIKNTNRSVGTMLSGKIAQKYGGEYLPDATIKFKFNGSAGQSFGAFLAKGVQFELNGEANDYFGKGLSGGRAIIKPFDSADIDPTKNIMVGNVSLYGATGGEAYIYGRAGERFCVRNSAANAVVEGVGDNACEYMTGGTVVILGAVGKNFAAGMSGGIVYIWDPEGQFAAGFATEYAHLEKILVGSEDDDTLKRMLNRHLEYTGSKTAKAILTDWEASLPKFAKVIPEAYKRILQKLIEDAQQTGADTKRPGQKV